MYHIWSTWIHAKIHTKNMHSSTYKFRTVHAILSGTDIFNTDQCRQYRPIQSNTSDLPIPTKHTNCTKHANLCTFEVPVHTTYSIQMNADNTDQYRVIPVTCHFLQNIPIVLYMPIFAHLKFQCMPYIPTQIVNCESEELAIYSISKFLNKAAVQQALQNRSWTTTIRHKKQNLILILRISIVKALYNNPEFWRHSLLSFAGVSLFPHIFANENNCVFPQRFILTFYYMIRSSIISFQSM